MISQEVKEAMQDKKRIEFANKSAEILAHQFVKTEGFDKTIAFAMTLTKAIWDLMQKEERFCIVAEYDAKALNVNISYLGEITDESEPESAEVLLHEKVTKEQTTEEFLADLKADFRSEEHQQLLKHFADCCRNHEASRDRDLKASEQS